MFYLVFEQGAWGNGDGLVVSVGLQIADDEGRAVKPSNLAQSRKVGHAVDIAIAFGPIGEGIAFDDVHFHVDG